MSETLERRLEAWARWCADTINVSPMIGYPRESPEQRAGMGSRPTGLAICRDDEAQVESVVACIAQRSRIHAEVLRVEYGASRGCGWSREYDTPRQDRNARHLGVGVSRYKQLLREARQQVEVGLAVQSRVA